MTATVSRRRHRFSATLFEGHKGVLAVLVPFDPEVVFATAAVEVAPRVKAWPIQGTFNAVPFEGWIGLRYGRFFMVVDRELKRAAKARLGSTVEIAAASTHRPSALAIAREQAEVIRHRRR